MTFTPLNTQHNRDWHLAVDTGKGVIDFCKAGIVYFSWQGNDGATIKAQCIEGLFYKNFKTVGEITEMKEPLSIEVKKQYIAYPFKTK